MYKTNNSRLLSLLAVFALTGIITLLFVTKEGIGLSPDSTCYIAAARNLLNGKGLWHWSTTYYGKNIPMTHWPPLFPTMLSVIGILGIDPLIGARWLNTLLFGANILLVGLIINRYTLNFWISTLGSFLMLTSVDMLAIHSMAWTEPLFIFFSFLGLFLLAAYLEEPKPLLIIISSSAIALGFLARYEGIELVATGIIGILLFSKKAHFKRIIDAGIFTTISCLPMLLWVLRNSYVSNTKSDGQLSFQPITLSHIKYGLGNILSWLLPASWPSIINDIVLLFLFVGFVIMFLRIIKVGHHRSDQNKQHLTELPNLLFIFILSYIGLYTASISFYVSRTQFDNRHLSPVFVSSLVIILCLSHNLLFSKKMRHIKTLFSLIYAIFAGWYLFRGTAWAITMHGKGRGFANKTWQRSPIIKRIKTLPAKTPIFANNPFVVYILTGRHAADIPNPLQTSDGYLSESAKIMKKQLQAQNGVVVYFNTTNLWYMPSEDKVKRLLPLRPITMEADGTIYKLEQQL